MGTLSNSKLAANRQHQGLTRFFEKCALPYKEDYYGNGQLERKGTYNVGEKCGEWIEDGETVTYDPTVFHEGFFNFRLGLESQTSKIFCKKFGSLERR